MAIITKTYGKILAALLVWLGFSCEMPGKQEYGTPTATYKAKGTVTSQDDNKPIAGIRAVLLPKNGFEGADTVYTDANGNFALSTGKIGSDNLSLKLQDVDNEVNGLYTDKEIEPDYGNEKFKGGDEWYAGTAEKDMGAIPMTPKK